MTRAGLRIRAGVTGAIALATLLVPDIGLAAGEVVFARGVATAQVGGGPVRFLNRGSALGQGDVVTTASRSYAVLRLDDGTKMTLRPDTVFALEQFETRQDEGSALMRLFKGGLRAITGFISKRRAGAMQVRTAAATIGIRGTDFEARFCAEDCVREMANQRPGDTGPTSPVVARVVFVRGQGTASSGAGNQRPLVLGSSLYEGDSIETLARSYAVVAFRDQSRVTLQPDSEFKIENFRLVRDEPERSSMFMRLLKGGLRAVTGLIGRRNRDGFRVAAPAATIGIRGTGFDVICQGDCVAPAGQGALPLDAVPDPLRRLLGAVLRDALAQPTPSGSGMFVSVWSGSIVLKLQGGDLVVGPDSTMFVPNDSSPPIPLPAMPVFIEQQLGPRPDGPGSSDPKAGEPFAATEGGSAGPVLGLYLRVKEGEIDIEDLDGDVTTLGPEEQAVLGDDGKPVRVVGPGPVITFSAAFLPSEFQYLFSDQPTGEGVLQCILTP